MKRMMATISAVAITAAVVTACGQADSAGSATETTSRPPKTTDAQPTSTSPAKPSGTTTTTTAPSTTVPEPTPAERLAAAQSDWERFINDLDPTLITSEVAFADGRLTAATSVSEMFGSGNPIFIWQTDEPGGWAMTDEVYLDVYYGWGATMPETDPSQWATDVFFNVLDIAFQDITGDGSAEMMVEYGINTPLGALFTHNGDQWNLVYAQERLYLEGDRVVGYERTCNPDCGQGVVNEYEIAWNGQQFERFYTSVGATSAATSSPACTSYRDQPSPPYSLCTKGPGVATLQEALIYNGYLQGPPDGYFGPATERAVRAAQRDDGEPEDGVAQGDWLRWFVEEYLSESAH